MNAAELREALVRIDGLYPTPEQFQVIEDAARTIALPILEGKPIRRRIGEILVKHFYPPSPVAFVDATDEILAAISNLTPVVAGNGSRSSAAASDDDGPET